MVTVKAVKCMPTWSLWLKFTALHGTVVVQAIVLLLIHAQVKYMQYESEI